MIFTFPHLGNTYIVAKAFLDDFDAQYVIPPFNTNKTMEIGSKYCSEANCLPFKLFVGNMLQAKELGADTMLITGGCGPCKLGYFCEMLKKTADDIGIDMEIITLEVPEQGLGELVSRIKKISGKANPVDIARAANSAKNVAVKVDKLERTARVKRSREQEAGSVDKICRAFKSDVIKVKGSKRIIQLVNETEKSLNEVSLNNAANPLKIAIVGEIYTTVEPYANFEIERILGNMGIEVERRVTVSDWIINDMIRKGLHLPRDSRYVKASKAYLGRMVGGHSQHTIGNSVIHAKEGYDGIIHLYPLGCMPEIVSQAILPAIEEDYQVPVMTVIRDEMTGEAGFVTRLEAFADLLKKRREEHINGQSKLLYGH
ncbi:putative nucleotide-binding protein (sugar kinase/HSP70/actin superfamily) [Ruminiclostridium sufflavum DSM 19573]|uniref:Putative nucleotide-binding protein (Sugar kinase/HSP70/actin superfamily) n=1 Tax=Ruminiclostridium sufflavum DSM 19573 TaxID=1121337 RepID=A0A318XVR5_9FIRM|nr:CoA protein activase [Ruminiclostridium sufflavum]PYG86907.1 putative nucleotide-binding protein (sugar kinase/HSP70/actin superfamily) [Ruminiclostridium sufflavum DSM 19573]